jgi:histidine phosphotransferase ChpT
MSTSEDPAAEPAAAPPAADDRQSSAAPPLAELPALDLASLLASRLCHDLISPASAIVSGLDLLDDPNSQDMREDAMTLISGSARKLVDSLQFARAAFGGGAESYSREDLHALAAGVFDHHRGELEWSMGPDALDKGPARALVNLAAIAAAALPMGGLAKIGVERADGEIVMTADAAGRRARLRPELLAGLNGEGPGEGLAGHWIQAAWTRALVAQAGGVIAVEPQEDRVLLSVRIPAARA